MVNHLFLWVSHNQMVTAHDPAAKGLHHDAVGRHGGIQLLLAHLLENPHAANLVPVPRVGVHHASMC